MKQAILITLSDSSREDVKKTTGSFMKEIVRVKNGATCSVRISIFNPDFSEQKDMELSKFVKWFVNGGDREFRSEIGKPEKKKNIIHMKER